MSIRINIGTSFDASDIRKARREIDRAEADMVNLSETTFRVSRGFATLSSRAAQLGTFFAQSITIPAIGAATAAVKMAADFSESMSRITGLVGIAAQEVKGMQGAVMDLSGETAKSPNELAEALFVVTSAGLRGTEAMDALGAAAKAGAAGLGATNDIARAVAGAMNAYGAETLDAARATDIIVATARAGNFATDQFASALGRVLPFAQQAQASLEDVGGAVALLTRTNGNAAESITQIQALFRAFVVPTEEAKKILDEVGLSAAQLRDEMGERGLVSALRLLDGRLGGNRELMGRLLSSTEAASAAFQILNSDSQTLVDTFGVVTSSVGMTEEAFGVVSGEPAFKFRQALNELQIAGINLGNTLLPTVTKLIVSFQGLVEKFNALDPEQQKTIIKWGLIIGLGTPLAAFAFSAVASLVSITVALYNMGGALAVATGGLSLLGVAIAGVVTYRHFFPAEIDKRAKALEAEGRAAELAAMGYDKYAASQERIARQLRAEADLEDQDEQRRRASESAQAYGEQLRAEAESARIAEEMQASLAEAMKNVEDATSSATSEVAASGPKVVRLTRQMRELYQELNDTHVGAGDAGAAIAQFSREVLAMGNITDATVKGAEKLAQVIKQDIDRSLADANRRLDEATDRFNSFRDAIAGGIRSGNTLADATRAQADAQAALASAQAAYEQAVASEDEDRIADAAKDLADAEDNQKTFLEFLGVGVTTAEGFAAQIDALREAGASLEVVQQIAELGARTGGRVAAELLAGGAEAIEQANRMVTAVEEASKRAGIAAAEQFFGAGVNAAKAMVRGIEATIPELQGVLDRIADAIERAMGVRPNVNIDGKTTYVQNDSPGTGGGAPPQVPRIRQAPWEPGPNIPYFDLQFLAEGGVVTSPVMGVVGEAGPEAIIPLDRMGQMGGQTVVNVTVTSADPQAVVEAIRRYTRANGPLGQVVNI